MRNNYEYTKALAQWAVERDVRFVYASSAATYGALEESLSDDSRSAYAAPAEHVRLLEATLRPLRAAQRHERDRIVGLKYFNVFGPNEDHKGEMRSIVSQGLRANQRERSVKLFQELSARVRATASNGATSSM